jgi:hypothetical protein
MYREGPASGAPKWPAGCGRRRGQAEPQDTGEGLEDLDRWIAVAALLKSEVAVGADAGEHGNLLAPQTAL